MCEEEALQNIKEVLQMCEEEMTKEGPEAVMDPHFVEITQVLLA
jgi:predicted RNase H-like HicB family nuclease